MDKDKTAQCESVIPVYRFNLQPVNPSHCHNTISTHSRTKPATKDGRHRRFLHVPRDANKIDENDRRRKLKCGFLEVVNSSQFIHTDNESEDQQTHPLKKSISTLNYNANNLARVESDTKVYSLTAKSHNLCKLIYPQPTKHNKKEEPVEIKTSKSCDHLRSRREELEGQKLSIGSFVSGIVNSDDTDEEERTEGSDNTKYNKATRPRSKSEVPHKLKKLPRHWIACPVFVMPKKTKHRQNPRTCRDPSPSKNFKTLHQILYNVDDTSGVPKLIPNKSTQTDTSIFPLNMQELQSQTPENSSKKTEVMSASTSINASSFLMQTMFDEYRTLETLGTLDSNMQCTSSLFDPLPEDPTQMPRTQNLQTQNQDTTDKKFSIKLPEFNTLGTQTLLIAVTVEMSSASEPSEYHKKVSKHIKKSEDHHKGPSVSKGSKNHKSSVRKKSDDAKATSLKPLQEETEVVDDPRLSSPERNTGLSYQSCTGMTGASNLTQPPTMEVIPNDSLTLTRSGSRLTPMISMQSKTSFMIPDQPPSPPKDSPRPSLVSTESRESTKSGDSNKIRISSTPKTSQEPKSKVDKPRLSFFEGAVACQSVQSDSSNVSRHSVTSKPSISSKDSKLRMSKVKADKVKKKHSYCSCRDFRMKSSKDDTIIRTKIYSKRYTIIKHPKWPCKKINSVYTTNKVKTKKTGSDSSSETPIPISRNTLTSQIFRDIQNMQDTHDIKTLDGDPTIDKFDNIKTPEHCSKTIDGEDKDKMPDKYYDFNITYGSPANGSYQSKSRKSQTLDSKESDKSKVSKITNQMYSHFIRAELQEQPVNLGASISGVLLNQNKVHQLKRKDNTDPKTSDSKSNYFTYDYAIKDNRGRKSIGLSCFCKGCSHCNEFGIDSKQGTAVGSNGKQSKISSDDESDSSCSCGDIKASMDVDSDTSGHARTYSELTDVLNGQRTKCNNTNELPCPFKHVATGIDSSTNDQVDNYKRSYKFLFDNQIGTDGGTVVSVAPSGRIEKTPTIKLDQNLNFDMNISHIAVPIPEEHQSVDLDVKDLFPNMLPMGNMHPKPRSRSKDTMMRPSILKSDNTTDTVDAVPKDHCHICKSCVANQTKDTNSVTNTKEFLSSKPSKASEQSSKKYNFKQISGPILTRTSNAPDTFTHNPHKSSVCSKEAKSRVVSAAGYLSKDVVLQTFIGNNKRYPLSILTSKTNISTFDTATIDMAVNTDLAVQEVVGQALTAGLDDTKMFETINAVNALSSNTSNSLLDEISGQLKDPGNHSSDVLDNTSHDVEKISSILHKDLELDMDLDQNKDTKSVRTLMINGKAKSGKGKAKKDNQSLKTPKSPSKTNDRTLKNRKKDSGSSNKLDCKKTKTLVDRLRAPINYYSRRCLCPKSQNQQNLSEIEDTPTDKPREKSEKSKNDKWNCQRRSRSLTGLRTNSNNPCYMCNSRCTNCGFGSHPCQSHYCRCMGSHPLANNPNQQQQQPQQHLQQPTQWTSCNCSRMCNDCGYYHPNPFNTTFNVLHLDTCVVPNLSGNQQHQLTKIHSNPGSIFSKEFQGFTPNPSCVIFECDCRQKQNLCGSYFK